MSTSNPEISIRPATNRDAGRVRELVFGVLREYGLEPAPEGIDRDLDDIEGSYIARGGVFELLEDPEGRLLGTVGLYPFGDGRIELRKMYFRKELRGKGYGKMVLRRMIGTAREMGYQTMVLETASVLKEAIGLYRKFGFVEKKEPHAPRCDQSFSLDLK